VIEIVATGSRITSRWRLGLAGLLAIFLVCAGCTQTRTPPARVADSNSKPVEFRASDGTILRGHLYGSSSTTIILAHQFNGNQSGWSDLAATLATHGYRALTFDFRGFPESDGLVHTQDAPGDLKAAYDFARSDSTRIFIVGASLGSDAAIILAASDSVAGLILMSTPVRFGGLDVEAAISRVTAPILFVESTNDPFVAGQSAILYNLARAPKSIQIYSGAEHGAEMLHGPHAAELTNLIERFLGEHGGEKVIR
jgi:esterase/lipase